MPSGFSPVTPEGPPEQPQCKPLVSFFRAFPLEKTTGVAVAVRFHAGTGSRVETRTAPHCSIDLDGGNLRRFSSDCASARAGPVTLGWGGREGRRRLLPHCSRTRTKSRLSARIFARTASIPTLLNDTGKHWVNGERIHSLNSCTRLKAGFWKDPPK
jgi:hypothetical protein